MEFNEYLMEDALSAIIDYRGKTPQKSESGIPTLSAKSVKNNYINYAECYYISEDEYKRFMVRGFPKKGDILLTTEAPMGMVARLDRDDIAIAQRRLVQSVGLSLKISSKTPTMITLEIPISL